MHYLKSAGLPAKIHYYPKIPNVHPEIKTR